MNLIVAGIIFALSLTAYSSMRYFDVRTTRELAEQLDLERHEINPLMVRLAKRFGLDGAFRITWVLFAVPIGIADVLLNAYISVNLPVFAFIFGFTHLLAAANNVEVAYTLKHSSVEEVEARTTELAAELKALSPVGRVKLILERNAHTFVTAVFSLVIIIDLYYANIIANITGLSFLAITMPNAGTVTLIALLLYFPSVALGLVIMSNRLARLPSTTAAKKAEGLEIDVKIAEAALAIAKKNGSNTILLQID